MFLLFEMGNHMRSGKCPKCNSYEIYRRKRYGATNTIGITTFTSAQPYIYVCASCGYYEHYIEGEKHLKNIKDKWDHIGPKRKNDER